MQIISTLGVFGTLVYLASNSVALPLDGSLPLEKRVAYQPGVEHRYAEALIERGADVPTRSLKSHSVRSPGTESKDSNLASSSKKSDTQASIKKIDDELEELIDKQMKLWLEIEEVEDSKDKQKATTLATLNKQEEKLDSEITAKREERRKLQAKAKSSSADAALDKLVAQEEKTKNLWRDYMRMEKKLDGVNGEQTGKMAILNNAAIKAKKAFDTEDAKLEAMREECLKSH